MNNPVGWFEIYVQDMARAKRFYAATLGIEFSSLESGDLEMWAFPMDRETVGAAGALVRMPGMPSGGNSVLVYFKTDDCAIVAEKAAAAGGQIEKPKFSIGPYGFIALVKDPDGNLFGLHSMS